MSKTHDAGAADIEDIYPLTHAQQGILFHCLGAPESGIYCPCFVYAVEGDVDIARLEQSWQRVVERHAVLRTAFVWEEANEPLQVVLRGVRIRIDVHDWTRRSPEEQQRHIEDFLRDPATKGHDLARAPLLRITAFRLAPSFYKFAMSFHHLILDGWSVALLLKEVFTFYHARHDRMATAPWRPALTFRDFVRLQQRVSPSAEAFWRAHLAGISSATPLQASLGEHTGSSGFATVSENVESRLTREIQRYARERQLTVGTILQGAWALLLGRCTGSTNVLYGTTVAGRSSGASGIDELVGMCINTLPTRVRIPGHVTVDDWLRTLHSQSIATREFEHTPLTSVQGWSDIPRGEPMFESLVVIENYPIDRALSAPTGGVQVVSVQGSEATHYPITLVAMVSDELVIELKYDRALFAEPSVSSLLSRYIGLIGELPKAGTRLLGVVSALTPTERQQVLVDWTRTESVLDASRLIHELLDEQAAKTPRRLAVTHGADELTFEDLRIRSNRLANYLRKLGVGPDVRVGICLQRSALLPVAIFGVLKAGGAYVPIDPSYPGERTAFMLEQSGAAFLLAETAVMPSVSPGVRTTSIRLDDEWPAIERESPDPPVSSATSSNLAYVIYTSGSTGQPKGVAIEHRNTVAFIHWCREWLRPEDLRGVFASTSVCFDVSVFELIATPCLGGTMILAANVLELPSSPRANAITLISTVPGAMSVLARGGLPPSLAVVLLGGEPVDAGVVRALHGHPQIREVWNLYGPTEDTTYSTFALLDPRSASPPPIGRPIANTRAYVLDAAMNPLPPGCSGEIYLAGAGLARGYLNRPDLTAERFQPNPFGSGERLYRTGDRGRFRPDGTLEASGRFDRQIKLRGHRIELGEIETVLRECQGVGEAVVLATEVGDKDLRLVAYWAPHSTIPEPAEAGLRAWLAARLPGYMVPQAFVRLAELPRTPNGKLDRRSLSEPPSISGEDAQVAPRTPTEERITRIVEDVLGRDRVGVLDDLFTLGMHSLLATQAVGRIRQAFEVDLPLRVVFETPTVEGLAATVERIHASARDASAAPPIDERRLSYAQERTWVLEQLQPGHPRHQASTALRLTGPLDVVALTYALEAVVDRHDILRTCFVGHGSVEQRVAPSRPLPVPVTDVAADSWGDSLVEVSTRLRQQMLVPFALDEGPMVRAQLLRRSSTEHWLLLTAHRLVWDEGSAEVMLRELSTVYGAFTRGEPAALPDPAPSHAAYAAAQRRRSDGDPSLALLRSWKDRLIGAPLALDLPTDRQRPAVQTCAGAIHRRALAPDTWDRAERAAARMKCSRAALALSAFAVLLARYARQSDLVVGLPVSDRDRGGLEGLIGPASNLVLVRVDLRDDPTFESLAGRVQREMDAAIDHRDVPFERLVHELDPDRDLSRAPLCQVRFQQAAQVDDVVLPCGLRLESVPLPECVTPFDLELTVVGDDREATVTLVYSTDLFEGSTAASMAGHFEVLLTAALDRPFDRVGLLPLMSENEFARFVMKWNATSRPISNVLVHELIAAKSLEAPNAEAIVCGHERITRADLERRSNRLAHYLRALGVAPDVPVGLCLGRSPAQMVAILAVLKAGGAYVPLDVTHPPRRLRAMLEDTNARVVLVDDSSEAILGALGARIVSLEKIRAEVDEESDTPPAVRLRPAHLAYVLFTSGSTGVPKGVEVTHEGLNNYLTWATRTYLERDEHGALVHSPVTFDLTVTSLFCPLLAGVPIEMAAEDSGIGGLRRSMDGPHSFGLVKLTPAHLTVLNEIAPPGASGAAVGSLVVGGEALAYEQVALWRERRPHTRIFNEYGPTETVVGCCVHEVRPDDPTVGPVPIGRPIDNTQLYVLDDDQRALPIGVPGELYIGGVGLARGYRARADLTAASFLPNPYGRPGDRIYRTGDRARLRADGALQYLGRVDHQIKVRGFRVEPGEIETALMEDERIETAVAVLRQDAAHGARLVAYYAVRAGVDAPTGPELKESLRERLPDYMVPAVFVRLEALPLTTNGKVDRAALPAPEPVRTSAREPSSTTERRIAELFCQLLGTETIGADDDFFEAGGHSVLAILLLGRVRKAFGVEVPLRALFELPTVARLAAHVDDLCRDGSSYSTAIRPATRTTTLPLSFAQQRLWIIDQLNPGQATYNNPIATRVRGPLDEQALEHALIDLVDRHEVLRTTFHVLDGAPTQRIHAAVGPLLSGVDLTDLTPEERDATVERLAREEAVRPFDLGEGPLLRVTVLHCGTEDYALLFTMHHIVCDGWSLAVLADEIGTLYQARRRGERPRLPLLPIQYADFAAWQRDAIRAETLQSQLAYWKRQLAGAPASLALPTDRPRRPGPRTSGRAFPFVLPPTLWRSVQRMAVEHHVTPFMLLLAAFQTLLYRYSGQSDIVVGTPIANRNHVEIEGLIGFFVNTLALRGDLRGRPGFDTLLSRTREVALGAYANQDIPFDKIVEELNPDRDAGGSPLFQVMFVLQNVPAREVSLGDLVLEPLVPETQTSKFDLTLLLGRADDGLLGTIEYDPSLFDDATVRRLAGHFEVLLRAVVADPQRPIDRIPLVSEEERTFIALCNQTDPPRPIGTVCEGIDARAASDPLATAVIFDDQKLSYEELVVRANRLAHHLRFLGVAREVRVALYLERSLEMVIAQLAVLKAGAAYVPIDPGYPAARVSFILEDADISAVLTQRSLRASPAIADVRIVCVDQDWAEVAGCDDGAPLPPPDARDLAYVLYTSGSTGTPKGVEIEHRALLNHMTWLLNTFAISSRDVVLQKTPFTFDASVWEFYGPLLSGAKLVLARPGGQKDNAYLAHTILKHQVTILQMVPSALRMLLEEPTFKYLSSLTRVFCGGEELTAELQQAFYRSSTARLYNLYGPTEACIDATHFECRRDASEERVPIGRPIDGTRVYLLDAEQELVPVGAVGEICIGGLGLARGYAKRADLTAERFVPDPFGGPGERLYRTGDRGRLRTNGAIEFLGRVDEQVKIRGHRIELGEIQVALGAYPGVTGAMVTVRGKGDSASLAAYYTLTAGTPRPSLQELRAHLSRRLPDYMLPIWYTQLDAFARLPSGKVDKRALPDPETASTAEYVAPRTDLERQICGIFAEVLGLDRAGIDDDFFQLGGHSLLATQVVTRVRTRLGIPLSLRAIFQTPTPFALAEHLAEGGSREAPELPPLSRAPRSGPLPLSHPQERLWVLDQIHPGRATYNVPVAVRLRGRLDAGALRSTLSALVARHEPLRTTFAIIDGGPVQRVQPTSDVPLGYVDLSHLPPAERERRVLELLEAETREPFDLQSGPLLRATLVACDARDYVLVGSMHHIVCDGWSMGVLAQEVTAFYESFRSKTPSALPDLTIQYADYARWQREWLRDDVFRSQLEYWLRSLEGAPDSLDLPTDRPRPPARSWTGAMHSFSIAENLRGGLERLCSRERVTLNMALLALFHTLLYRYSGQPDIVIGTPVANRPHPALEGLIGFFLNMVAIRIRHDGEVTFRDLLALTREAALGAYAHQEVPFERVVEAVNPKRDLGRWPVFQVMFVLQNAPVTELELPELTIEPLLADTHTAKFDLTFVVEPTKTSLTGTFQYDTDLFDAATIEGMAGAYERMLAAVLEDPGRPVAGLSLVSAAAQEHLHEQTDAPDPQSDWEAGVHERIDQQAERRPAAPALVVGTRTLTYGELRRRSDELGQHLRSLGVGPESRVAVSLERSLEMLVAVLAVLKAGGAYVAVDPTAADRSRSVLEDAGVSVVLTQSGSRSTLPAARATTLCVDEGFASAGHAHAPIGRAVHADHLASVMYPSVTDDRPTGVMWTHRGLLERVLAIQSACPLSEDDRVLVTMPPSQATSGLELIWPLMAGARLVLPATEDDGDVACPGDLLVEQGITTLYSAPSTIEVLVQSEAGVYPCLRRVCVTGEDVAPALAHRFLTRFHASLLGLDGLGDGGIEVTHWDRRPESRAVPTRRAIAARQYVLDRELQPVPLGVAGELSLGGGAIARGYVDQPDLTAEHFLPDPFGPPGARLHRTGSRARYGAGGELLIVGRLGPAAVDAIESNREATTADPCEAPRDAIELELVRIWEDLLGRTGIGVTDDFFQLGGHSLLGARVMLAVRERLGVALPLSTLFHEPTIRVLAAALRRHDVTATSSPLLEIQPKGSRPPLFCIHPAGGTSAGYVELARALGSDQPVYGLEADRVLGGGAPAARIEEMAARYLDAIRSVQPHGPYHLGGWSLGGVIAFEMAKQLRSAGEPAALVALFDTHAPTLARRDQVRIPTDSALALCHLAGRDIDSVLPSRSDDWAQHDEGERLVQVAEALSATGLLPAGVSAAEVEHFVRVYQHQVDALTTYESPRTSEPLVLFRAREGLGDDDQDLLLGWDEVTTADIEVRVVPGSHDTMVRTPYVAGLAEELGRFLGSARTAA